MQRDHTKAGKQGGPAIHGRSAAVENRATLTVAMAARRLGATRMKVRYLVTQGRIAAEKAPDGRLYFSEAEVARVLALGGVDALALPKGAALTAAKVAEIKRWLADGGVSQAQIARVFGVSKEAIWQIAHGKTWPDVAPAREVA